MKAQAGRIKTSALDVIRLRCSGDRAVDSGQQGGSGWSRLKLSREALAGDASLRVSGT